MSKEYPPLIVTIPILTDQLNHEQTHPNREMIPHDVREGEGGGEGGEERREKERGEKYGAGESQLPLGCVKLVSDEVP